ncbi:MAG: Na/Pi cotransporter family protein [Ruminiclostridium sp.]|nr:Na/Pi cotransporter family protein [Ruminiclostridium sp.]
MDSSAVIAAVLSLIAGIGIFLVACSTMSSNLESLSSNKLKALFSKASASKLVGVGIGTVGTAAIQSSGATTVMVIGFVNAGIMTLAQAATIVYGANIGTTITGQIVALGMFGNGAVSTTIIFSALAGVGAFIMTFAKNGTLKKTGGILAGFGMLFVGLSMMSGSMENFARLEAVRQFLAGINSTLLLILIGALLTALIQSSSVMTSVAITMVVTGLISLEQGIYLTMGSNIGSCVVAVMAGFTSGKNAKRTALLHLIFNISGVVVFAAAGILVDLISGGTLNYGILFEDLFPGAPQTQLAMFHTVFNVLTVIIVLPLTNVLVRTVEKIIPDDPKAPPENKLAPKLHYIDDHMLSTPPIAVQQVKNEIVNMSEIAMRNFSLSCDIVTTLDYSDIEQFRANENELNFLNKEIVRFLVKLSSMPLNERDTAYISTAFHAVTDLERVGDYAENIVEYADKLKSADEHFSIDAVSEIRAVCELIEELFSHIIYAYIHNDLEALERANEAEDEVDEVTAEMADNHIQRLSEGICTADVGAQYLSLSSDAERVADHFINVGKAIKQFI